MRHIGGVSFNRYPLRSHNWGRGMNDNLIKLAILLKPGVISKTTPIPASGDIDDCYIDPSTGRIVMRVAAFNDSEIDYPEDWVSVAPSIGVHVYVADEEKFYVYNWNRQWEQTVNVNQALPSVSRELGFYVPGPIRPSATIFQYVAGIEIVFAANDHRSSALLDVPPTGDLTFNIQTSGGNGTIFFEGGSDVGIVTFAQETEVYAAVVDSMMVRPNTISIRSPSNLKSAEGLTVTLRGKIEGAP